jgi:hypothetical protein
LQSVLFHRRKVAAGEARKVAADILRNHDITEEQRRAAVAVSRLPDEPAGSVCIEAVERLLVAGCGPEHAQELRAALEVWQDRWKGQAV